MDTVYHSRDGSSNQPERPLNNNQILGNKKRKKENQYVFLSIKVATTTREKELPLLCAQRALRGPVISTARFVYLFSRYTNS
jgi:hypothetical protein